jgi:hypothetical protein
VKKSGGQSTAFEFFDSRSFLSSAEIAPWIRGAWAIWML